jgi:trans-aconitate 2-methyltransferase
MTRHAWDGRVYDRIGTPQAAWGRAVLERLPLHGDETVLDAGCGSGRVTEMLLERLPRGRVLAVDGSASMLEAARERLGDDPRVAYLEQDLLDLDLGGARVDAVLSTAVFHWVPDHDRLFRGLHGALLPGGRLVAQCGGRGNLDTLLAEVDAAKAEPPFAEHLAGRGAPSILFAGAPETERRLRAAGFAEARCRLTPAPVMLPEPRVFLEAVTLGRHLERLPAELREPFLDAVMSRLGDEVLADYVRLDIDAVA